LPGRPSRGDRRWHTILSATRATAPAATHRIAPIRVRRHAAVLRTRTLRGGRVNFNSLLIGSEQPDRLVAHYTKLRGARGFSMGGYTGWQIGSGFLTIGPHSEVHGKNVEPGRIIWNIETTDVRGEFARMQAAGAIVVREPYVFEGEGEAMGSA